MKNNAYRTAVTQAWLVLSLLSGGQAIAGEAEPAQAAQAAAGAPGAGAAPVSQAQPAQPPAASTVQELQQLMKANALLELRTSYNGSFGTSLLFHPREMTYYATMFQQKDFWRVVKTQDETQAEAVFTGFARESLALADVEIRRIKLAAQKEYTERMIASSEGRLNQLQADLALQRESQAQVANKQKIAREQATALDSERRAAQNRLDGMRRQIRALEVQSAQGAVPANR